MKKRALFVIFDLLFFSGVMLAVVYSQPFAASHGWTYTQVSCTGGGTCTSGDVSDGNPTPGVFAKIAGKNKAMVGYETHAAYAWTDLGVTAGNNATQVDAKWDDFTIQTVAACLSTTTAGMDIYDSANTTRATASQVEPDLNVAADTGAWTNHDPTGAIAVSAAYQAAATTVTLRFNLNPASANSTGAACELRGDNYVLTITEVTPSGQIIIISTLIPREARPRVLWTREVR